MNKEHFKRFAAFTMASVLALGSAVTVSAAEGTTPSGNKVSVSGNVKYEGTIEEAIPMVSIALPTASALRNVYDYVADPNNLIASTTGDTSLGADATVDGDAKGILFRYDTDKYGSTSKAITVSNPNYRDVDVTVELKVKDAAKVDKDIVYAGSVDAVSGNKAKNLYLAITDTKDQDPRTAPLTSNTGTVKLTQTISGNAANFELKYNADKYEFTKKTGEDLTWNDAAFALTGALNTNAVWGKDVQLPMLEVTWSFKEHTDSLLAVSTVKASSNVLTIPAGVTVKKVTLVQSTGKRIVATSGSHYTFTSGKLTLQATMLSGNVGGTLEIELEKAGKIQTETVAIK